MTQFLARGRKTPIGCGLGGRRHHAVVNRLEVNHITASAAGGRPPLGTTRAGDGWDERL